MLDVAIVGSGPAAFTAAIYSARAGFAPAVYASSVSVGGELMNTTEVENFPGFPEGVMGPDLMQRMQEQAERFGAAVHYEDVSELSLGADVKRLRLGGGDEVAARAVIYATGSAYRKLRVPGEEELTGHGVSWCATCDGFFFKDKVVAVVGGGDSAMEEAVFLSRFARRVYIVHRRESLRASKIMQERAHANEKIEFVWNSRVSRVLGDSFVTGVELASTVDGGVDVRELALDGVFIAVGNDPRTQLLAGQLELSEAGNVWVQGRSSRTSVPFVYAAGDVIDPTYRQAIVAAASGASAALDAEHDLLRG